MTRTQQLRTAVLGAIVVLGPAWLAEPVAAGGDDRVEAIHASLDIPAEQLLDVGIEVFDPGLPEEDEHAQEERGVFPELRKSEARYFAYHLKQTLESTGQWGAVRVLPSNAEGSDVNVSGAIVVSHGKTLAVQVTVVDALGQVWIDKRYKRAADVRVYRDQDELIEDTDPYQSLYNSIANDMVRQRAKLKSRHVRAIREVSRLAFAADLAPQIYGDYLRRDKKGRLKVERLPAEGDPMMRRIRKIRERDFLFVDTLNDHYGDFYWQMTEPYDEFRSISYEEQKNLQAVRREARKQMIFGGILTGAAVLIQPTGAAGRLARAGAGVVGGKTLAEGIATRKDAKIHVEALRELAQSFDREMEPILMEVDGQVLKLEGNAEAQYADWRRLLHEIFREETGLPLDPDAGPHGADDGAGD